MGGQEVSPADSFAAAKLGAFDFVALDRDVEASALTRAVKSALYFSRAPRVFICYSGTDRPTAHRLVEVLRTRGLQVWYDEWEVTVGDSIIEKVESGIAGSGFLIVLLSPASITSRWVREEVNAAMIRTLESKKMSVLPVLVEECQVPPFLRSRKYADLRTSFDRGVDALVKVITSA